MEFNLQKSIEVLEKTPGILTQMLTGLSDEWIQSNEGGETWSPFVVIGHLVHGEETDWIPRLEICLSEEGNKNFTPFDRFAQLENSKGKKVEKLLEQFTELRRWNLQHLKEKNITNAQLDKKAFHPALGEVTLRQLLSTWVVHDLNHIAQVARVMAHQYKNNVGPWTEYLRILN